MYVLFGIDNNFRFDASIRKKLLRFDASLSALAVIVPINSFGHYSFPYSMNRSLKHFRLHIKATACAQVKSSLKSSDFETPFLSLLQRSGMILGPVIFPMAFETGGG